MQLFPRKVLQLFPRKLWSELRKLELELELRERSVFPSEYLHFAPPDKGREGY